MKTIKVKNIIVGMFVGVMILMIFFFIQIHFYNYLLKPEIKIEIEKETYRQILKRQQERELQFYNIFKRNKKINC